MASMSEPTPAKPNPGSEPFLARWVRDHAEDLHRFLAKRRIIESDIKDVCQEVYLRILRFERSEVIEKPTAYLFRVAANVAHDFKLRQSKWLPLGAETLDAMACEPGSDQLIDLTYRKQVLMNAVANLPPIPRAAITLQAQEGLTYEAIAERLGVSQRVVKRAVVRAYASLRKTLGKDV